MNIKKYNGFSLIEILVSFWLLSCLALNFTALQLYAIRKMHSAYYFHLATNQLRQMAERLRALKKSESLSAQVARWNEQNQELLPQGRGVVIGQYPQYTVAIYWGNQRACQKNSIGEKGCLKKTIQL